MGRALLLDRVYRRTRCSAGGDRHPHRCEGRPEKSPGPARSPRRGSLYRRRLNEESRIARSRSAVGHMSAGADVTTPCRNGVRVLGCTRPGRKLGPHHCEGPDGVGRTGPERVGGDDRHTGARALCRRRGEGRKGSGMAGLGEGKAYDDETDADPRRARFPEWARRSVGVDRASWRPVSPGMTQLDPRILA